MPPVLWLTILNSAILPVSLTLTINKLVYLRKILVAIVALYLGMLTGISALENHDFQSIAVHVLPAVFLAIVLWESRNFNIDSFSYRKLVTHLDLFVFPLSVLAVTISGKCAVHWGIFLVNCLTSIVLSETLYPLCKRKSFLRQAVNPRVYSTVSSTIQTPLATRRIH